MPADAENEVIEVADNETDPYIGLNDSMIIIDMPDDYAKLVLEMIEVPCITTDICEYVVNGLKKLCRTSAIMDDMLREGLSTISVSRTRLTRKCTFWSTSGWLNFPPSSCLEKTGVLLWILISDSYSLVRAQ